MKLRHALLQLVAVLGLVSAAHTAQASPDYPEVIRDELDLPCTPQCILCHTGNPGRAGSAKQPFVDTLGVLSGQPQKVREKIRELVEAMPADDTDGDGMPDIEELQNARDPNVEGEGDICALDVRYGCGARVEPQGPLSSGGALGALLTVAALSWSLRRRKAASG
jgi:hypothetical protein